MSKSAIKTEYAPKAIGPYSAGIQTGKMVFTAGQLGLVPSTGELVNGVEEQTRQALQNIRGILDAAGASMDQIVKTTVFLQDMKDFPAMNAVYATFFGDTPPARSTVQVAGLPKAGLVEIEAIAILD
jgi:2-iminobutanoate/2-iminopropanoate deaminase